MRNIILSIIFLIAIIIFMIFIIERTLTPNKSQVFGVSFSPTYTEYLGLNYQEVYQKAISDLGFNYVRLMAQWDEIENIKGEYDFTKLDWLMNESAKNNVKVILALGRKTPRWPECHLPDWAKDKDYKDYRADLLNYMRAVVKRYKDNKSLETWQVENEPFLSFGVCKNLPREDLTNEINLVRKLDDKSHPILVTDSGELSTWRKTGTAGDLFGTTMYRVVWNKWTGYFNYDWLPALFYIGKLKMVGRDIQETYVVELQAEPWIPNGSILDTAIDEQFKSMDLNRLKKNVIFSQKTNMPRSYLWGVEWWYWLADKQNNNSFLEYVKSLNK